MKRTDEQAYLGAIFFVFFFVILGYWLNSLILEGVAAFFSILSWVILLTRD